MRRVALVVGILFVGTAVQAFAVSPADEAAIKQAAMDYVEGWYEGSMERMDKALHPELVKRMVVTHPKTGAGFVNDAGKSMMLVYTEAGGGSDKPEAKDEIEYTLLDIYHNIAAVKLVSADFMDYLHVVKWNGEWKILNVLWQPLAKEEP